jgi:hypothetical protein
MALSEIEGPFDILLVDYIITSNIQLPKSPVSFKGRIGIVN